MNNEVFKKIWIDKDELLQIVRDYREKSEDYTREIKLEIEADLKLLKQKRDKKKWDLVWDSTLYNTHRKLITNSFQSKNTIQIKWDKWDSNQREIKMLNSVLSEDNSWARDRALKYYLFYDKFATWVGIKARTWWDGVYKRPIFTIVNPLTWLPQVWWDYFTGDYQYTGFFSIERKEKLEKEGFTDIMKEYSEWAIEKNERMQRLHWLFPDYWTEVVDVCYHFVEINGIKIMVRASSLDQVILDVDFVEPNSILEEKNPEAITFPFAFYYWWPDRDNPFGDRPANYIRDVQLQKAEIANLRLNKMRAELYPMYLYNKQAVNGVDLQFGINKAIPVKMGMWGEQYNINNVVSPIQKDLRIDTSITVDQLLDKQVERSTWWVSSDLSQWATPQRKETLGTNQLAQWNTDSTLQLNEEIHAVWDEQYIKIWFWWYYKNFKSWDKKFIYAWASTGKQSIVLKRKDFIYDGNLNISIESNISSEDRKRKETAAAVQIHPLVSTTLNPASQVIWNRYLADTAWIPKETIEEVIIDTPQMTIQRLENDILKDNQFLPINANDDHEQHLIAMDKTIDTEANEAHKLAHIMEFIKQGWMQQPQQWLDKNAMNNSMAAQAMSQAQTQLTS